MKCYFITLSPSPSLISSYAGNVTKYGLAILILHDIADPLMEVAKMCFTPMSKWVRERY